MKNGCLLKTVLITLFGLGVWVGVTVFLRSDGESEQGGRNREARAYPVEVAPVQTGTLDENRVFSASLAPSAQLILAPKVTGRITGLTVDISDPVRRGQVVVTLDDAEFRQAVARAEADLAVTEARYTEATNRLSIASRELERAETLHQRGISSDATLDNAKAEYLIRDSAARVADADRSASRAALETSRIRLDYTQVAASWSEGDDTRVVAERLVDEGGTVAPNTPLLTIVEIDPLKAVFYVPERDYGRLSKGQKVTLMTDAWPGEPFEAIIERVAPIFQEDSRQARVELNVPNADERLKPGMFVRATVTLAHVENTTMIQEAALTRRGENLGVFHLQADRTVKWVPVTTGIRDGNWVQLTSPELTGEVVVLGQNLLADGASVLLTEKQDSP